MVVLFRITLQTARDLGRYEEALRAYDHSIALDPANVSPWNRKGDVLYNLDRYEEALQAYDQIIAMDPTNGSPWNRKGDVLYNLDRYEEALAAFNQSIKLDPENMSPWNNKGAALNNLGRHEEALAAFEQGIEVDPNSWLPWFGKGNTLQTIGRYEQALQAYEQKVVLESNHWGPLNNKGKTLCDLGRYDDASQAFKQSIALEPNNPIPWNGKGVALYRLGHIKDALTTFEQSITLDPNKWEPWNGKGSALKQLGRYEDALLAYEKSITREPTNFIPWQNKANLLLITNKAEQALPIIQQALRLGGNRASPWREYARITLALGMMPVSCLALNRYISLAAPKEIEDKSTILLTLIQAHAAHALVLEVVLRCPLLLQYAPWGEALSASQPTLERLEFCVQAASFFVPSAKEMLFSQGIANYLFQRLPHAHMLFSAVLEKQPNALGAQYYAWLCNTDVLNERKHAQHTAYSAACHWYAQAKQRGYAGLDMWEACYAALILYNTPEEGAEQLQWAEEILRAAPETPQTLSLLAFLAYERETEAEQEGPYTWHTLLLKALEMEKDGSNSQRFLTLAVTSPMSEKMLLHNNGQPFATRLRNMALLKEHGWLAELWHDYKAEELQEPLRQCMEQLAKAWDEALAVPTDNREKVRVSQLLLRSPQPDFVVEDAARELVYKAYGMHLQHSLKKLGERLSTGVHSGFFHALPENNDDLRRALDKYVSRAKESNGWEELLSYLLQNKRLTTHQVIEYVSYLQVRHESTIQAAMHSILPISISVVTGAVLGTFVSPMLGGASLVAIPALQHLFDSRLLSLTDSMMEKLSIVAKNEGMAEFRETFREFMQV